MTSAAAGCALLLLTAAACSSDASGPSPTSGADVDYRTVTQGHLQVSLPASWSKSTDVTKPYDVKYSGNGMEVQIAGEYGDESGAYTTLATLDLPATLNLPRYQPGPANRITVDGAHDAATKTFTYVDGNTKKEGVWIVATQFPYPASAVVTVTGAPINHDVLSFIQKNLTFKTYH